MATIAEALAATAQPPVSDAGRARTGRSASPVLIPWIGTQSINVVRHAAALRPFRADEFGAGAAAPTPGHLEAVNKLITSLRRGMLAYSKSVTGAARAAARE